MWDTPSVTIASWSQGLQAQRGTGTHPRPSARLSRSLLAPHTLPTLASVCHEVSWPVRCSTYQRVGNEKSGPTWQEGAHPVSLSLPAQTVSTGGQLTQSPDLPWKLSYRPSLKSLRHGLKSGTYHVEQRGGLGGTSESGPVCRVGEGLRVGLSLGSSRLELKTVVGQVLGPVWILLDTVLARESGEAPSTLNLQPDSRWDRPGSNSKIANELWLCGLQEKVVPLTLRMGQWKKLTSLFVGTPLPLPHSCLWSHFP